MTTRPVLASLVLLLSFPSAARAAPIHDVGPWVEGFTMAALANDPDAMAAKAREVIHPRFPSEALRGIFDKIDAVVGTRPGDHAELFDEADVGTIWKRVDVAVRYPNTDLYYSLTFLDEGAGWQLYQIDYNTDVNEVFKLSWPS